LTAFDENSRDEGFLCMWNVTLHPRYYTVVGRHSPSHVILRTVWYENEPFYLPKMSDRCLYHVCRCELSAAVALLGNCWSSASVTSHVASLPSPCLSPLPARSV